MTKKTIKCVLAGLGIAGALYFIATEGIFWCYYYCLYAG